MYYRIAFGCSSIFCQLLRITAVTWGICLYIFVSSYSSIMILETIVNFQLPVIPQCNLITYILPNTKQVMALSLSVLYVSLLSQSGSSHVDTPLSVSSVEGRLNVVLNARLVSQLIYS